MPLFRKKDKPSASCKARGHIRCSTEQGTVVAHTSVFDGQSWQRQETPIKRGDDLQVAFARLLTGPLGYPDGGPPDKSYMHPPGEEAEDDEAPDDYEEGFSVPVHWPGIGWLDWTSSSRYLKVVIEQLYDAWTLRGGDAPLVAIFTGFRTLPDPARKRDYHAPEFAVQSATAAAPSKLGGSTGVPSRDNPPKDDALDDDAIPL
jgi:hypothetical protein